MVVGCRKRVPLKMKKWNIHTKLHLEKDLFLHLKKNQKCSTVLNVQKGWGRGSKGIICFQGQVIVPQSQDRTDHSEPAG